MLRLTSQLALLLLCILSGCTKKSSSSGTSDPTANLSPPLFISANRVTGLVGSTFELTAVLPAGTPPATEIRWQLGDGRTAIGSPISTTYATEGLYEVTVELVSATPTTTATEVLQVVSAQLDAPLFGIAPLPSLPGDVDGDAALTLLDLQLLGSVAGNLTPGSQAILLSGDLDRDGAITDEDVRLLGEVFADETPFPSALSGYQGPPGSVVNILSPRLLDRSAIATIRIGSAPARTFFQPAPGYGTFLVPFDAAGPASLLPITPQQVEVALLIDGVVVETHKFEVVNPTRPTGQEVDLLIGACDTLLDAVGTFESSLSQQLTLFSASAEETAALRAVTQRTFELLGEGIDSLKALRDVGSRAERAALEYMLRANGLDEILDAVADLQGSSTLSEGGGSVFESELEYFCKASEIKELVESFADIASTSCAVASAGLLAAGLVTGGATIPFALGVSTACENFELANDIFEIVAGFLPSLDGELKVTARDAGIGQKEIQVFASFKENYWCTGAVGITGPLVKRLTEKIIKRIPITRIALELIKRSPLENRSQLRRLLVDEIRSKIELLLGRAFDNGAVQAFLESIREKVCTGFVGTGQSFLLDPARCNLEVNPVSAGALLSFSAESALFICATGFSGDVLVEARRTVCNESTAGIVTFTCGGENVSICVGDNGPALDDIFEVVLNGESIIAPSVPVRSACATRDLASGLHTVQAIGRAAPDGIGTYFISFTPATVVSGPPLSGADLTAGTIFTWTIRVGGQ